VIRPAQAPGEQSSPCSQFLNSIARPKFHIERGPAARTAFPAAQLPLERYQARIPGPPLQQPRDRDDRFVPAGVAARAHQVEDAQVLEAEGVARRHGTGLFIPAAYRIAIIYLTDANDSPIL
jgi:hypothetical protein